MKLKRILSLACAVVIGCSCLTACGDKTDEKDSKGQEEMGPVVLTKENVKLVGRTTLIDDTLWLAFSGTGAKFDYEGKKLDITFVGDGAAFGGEENMARVAVYVDGERVVDELINEKEKTVTAFENAESKKVNVQIIKLSETAMSTVGVKPITLGDGEKITPVSEKEHKIEFVGDSITCGYGVDDEDRDHHFVTGTEDVTKAYAYKTAQKLDADYSMVSISGYGIISGYTGNGQKVPVQTIPQYYDKLGFSYQSFDETTAPQSLDWDFANYTPDVIVINLGTNDNSYVSGKADRKKEYYEGYISFIKTIREKNPDAEIFCVLGLMGSELYNTIEDVVYDYSKETGDAKIHAFKLPTQDASLGYAADWHPVEANHEIAAEAMAEGIKTVMGW